MKLKVKVFAIMAIAFCILLGTLFYVSKQQENNELKNSIELVHNLIQGKINSLNRATGNWAPWDEMYNFVKQPTQGFIDSNFDASTASNLQLNLLAVIKDDKILLLKSYDYKTKQEIEDINKIEKNLVEYLLIINNSGNKSDLLSGIISINNQPMLISIRPITDSAQRLPQAGILIMGEYLDSTVTDSIQSLSKGTLTVTEAEEYKGILGEKFDQTLTNIISLNDDKIKINYFRNDLFLNKSFNIELTSIRNTFNQEREYLEYFVILSIMSLLLVYVIRNQLLKRFIIKPIENINSEVIMIDANNMLDMRVEVNGNDEFAILSREINSMLDRTDSANKKNIKSENQSYYDNLTGLFNRGYYEIILNNLNKMLKLPITILIADANGLKLINNTFSHTVGDKMLIEVSKILKKACGENALISRLGGDEFAIIIEDSNENMANNIFKTIKKLCNETQVNSLSISLALGYSTKHNENEDIYETAKIAEERMYRNKLAEKKSTRNSTILSLSKMLFEKSYETEEHAIRMFKICEKIGKTISMTSAQLDELNLLAKLHDIGKVAIPDNILNKPGKLNEDEFEIIRTHTQIGHRIAIELVDLRDVAYQILCHHENYDGSGYPNGIKGNAIPLPSRIIRIVDSFDVMVSGRPYRMPMTKQEAIKELQKYSAKHYDPELIRLFIEVYVELEEEGITIDSQAIIKAV